MKKIIQRVIGVAIILCFTMAYHHVPVHADDVQFKGFNIYEISGAKGYGSAGVGGVQVINGKYLLEPSDEEVYRKIYAYYKYSGTLSDGTVTSIINKWEEFSAIDVTTLEVKIESPDYYNEGEYMFSVSFEVVRESEDFTIEAFPGHTLTFTFSKTAEMYRMYNPNSGEHFYTNSDAEKNNLVNQGWKYEGVGWTAPVTGSPVYRLYNKNGGEHHYTLSEKERDALVKTGWKNEGFGWYSADASDANAVPLYREYNPNAYANNHNYTASNKEHSWLLGLGWKDEGIAWYGVKESNK